MDILGREPRVWGFRVRAQWGAAGYGWPRALNPRGGSQPKPFDTHTASVAMTSGIPLMDGWVCPRVVLQLSAVLGGGWGVLPKPLLAATPKHAVLCALCATIV